GVELCQRARYGGGRPAVADAIAQAVFELQLERAAAAPVVPAPMRRVAAHGGEDRLAYPRAAPFAQPFALDAIERPHRFAQREGQCRTHLENGEVVAHE